MLHSMHISNQKLTIIEYGYVIFFKVRTYILSTKVDVSHSIKKNLETTSVIGRYIC